MSNIVNNTLDNTDNNTDNDMDNKLDNKINIEKQFITPEEQELIRKMEYIYNSISDNLDGGCVCSKRKNIKKLLQLYEDYTILHNKFNNLYRNIKSVTKQTILSGKIASIDSMKFELYDELCTRGIITDK